jgi:hypothetical protein
MAKVLSTQKIKELFGDFSYTDLEGGRIKIDTGWVSQNIVTVEIPQLTELTTSHGKVQFHVKGQEQLKSAFAEIERQGLSKYLATWDGSWVPRHMLWNKKKSLSHHSWGIAFDINARWNNFGSSPVAEGSVGSVRQLVPIFAAHGFCWGGEWSPPDGMHFELAELNPISQFVKLIIDGLDIPTAKVTIQPNGRSYGLLGPISKAIGITDPDVITNEDPVPVAAFLKGHRYKVVYKAEGCPKGTIYATRE